MFIPESVSIITNNAFSGCLSLKYLYGLKGLKYIGKEAFACCGFTDLVLPEGLLYIGDRAFCDSSLHSILLPSSLIEIGKDPFLCNDLEYIFIPSGCKEKYASLLGAHYGKVIEVGTFVDWSDDDKVQEKNREHWKEIERERNDADSWRDYQKDNYSDEAIWGTMTDGMYGDYPDEGFDGDYEFMGY